MKATANIALALILALTSMSQAAVRIKDFSRLAGADGVRLIGYGLVVGLDRTGDSPKSLFTNQSLTNMLERFGIAVNGDKVRSKNIAAVIVTAEVPPYSLTGGHFDVLVSSLGDAKSLQGGVLLQTTLADINGETWAMASGPIAIGGFSIETERISVRASHPVVGRISNGGLLKRDVGSGVDNTGSLTFVLNYGDFTTAGNMASAINFHFEEEIATAVDAKSVVIKVPEKYAASAQIVSFISVVENIRFDADSKARVVINERTGTIIIGQSVSITPVAVSHGTLSITIKTTPLISQALPFAPGGETVVERTQEIQIDQRDIGVVALPEASTAGDIAAALNRLGLSPLDIIAIFQALKHAGALQAELVII